MSRLYISRFSRKRPFSNRYERADLVFLDQLDIWQVVGDGQQLQFHQDIGGNLIADAVFTTLLSAAFGILGSLDLSPCQFANREFSAKHKPERGQVRTKAAGRHIDASKETLPFPGLRKRPWDRCFMHHDRPDRL